MTWSAPVSYTHLDVYKRQVFNAPFSNTRSVAELALAETILLLRGIPQRNAAAHHGGWVKTATGSHEARGKCLGIVGYGHIGTQVGVLAEALGMRVVFYDIGTKLTLGNVQSLPTLDALLEMADVVTLHVPETPQTFKMIGAAQLARMKPGAALINAARGTVAVSYTHLDVYKRQAESNLSNLDNQIHWLEPVPPDEEARKHIEALQA